MLSGRIQLVVFDMTGTTVSDDGLVVEAYRAALKMHEVPHDDADIFAARGASKREVFQRLVRRARPEASAPEVEQVARGAHADFERFLASAYATGPLAPMPGAVETFRWLRGHGIRVATTTGFDRSLRDLILRRLAWDAGVLDAVVASDEVARGRPAPDMIHLAMSRAGVADPRRIAVVGDTVVDLQAGASAGAGLIVGVLTGAHDRDTLLGAPHTHILNSVAELPTLLENCLPHAERYEGSLGDTPKPLT